MSKEAGAQRWRKKPVVVEAKQWLKHGDHSAVRPYETAKGWIETLEGGHIVNPGDWIITGVKGEHYPCKPDIFAQTYEPVEAEVTQPADDDARLAEIRLLLTERPGKKLPSDTNKMRFLLRLLDEAHAERDALAVKLAKAREVLEAIDWNEMSGAEAARVAHNACVVLDDTGGPR